MPQLQFIRYVSAPPGGEGIVALDIRDAGGGARPDELVGDGGRDTFVYTAITDSRAGREARDFINGFTHGLDRIDLSLIDANARTADVNEAFDFIGKQPFSGKWGASGGN